MKKLIISLTLLLLLTHAASGQARNALKDMKMETHNSKILKVFFALEGDAQFVAYKVKWKGQEIIITDMFSKVPKNVGDSINFISQSMQLPNMGNAGIEGRKSILQFTVMPDINLPNLKP